MIYNLDACSKNLVICCLCVHMASYDGHPEMFFFPTPPLSTETRKSNFHSRKLTSLHLELVEDFSEFGVCWDVVVRDAECLEEFVVMHNVLLFVRITL